MHYTQERTMCMHYAPSTLILLIGVGTVAHKIVTLVDHVP